MSAHAASDGGACAAATAQPETSTSLEAPEPRLRTGCAADAPIGAPLCTLLANPAQGRTGRGGNRRQGTAALKSNHGGGVTCCSTAPALLTGPLSRMHLMFRGNSPLVAAVGVETQAAQRGNHGGGVHICVIVRFEHEQRVQIVHHPLECQEHLCGTSERYSKHLHIW